MGGARGPPGEERGIFAWGHLSGGGFVTLRSAGRGGRSWVGLLFGCTLGVVQRAAGLQVRAAVPAGPGNKRERSTHSTQLPDCTFLDPLRLRLRPRAPAAGSEAAAAAARAGWARAAAGVSRSWSCKGGGWGSGARC